MSVSKLSIGVLFLICSTTVLFAQTDNDTIKKEQKIEGVILRGTTNKGAESNIISVQKKSVEVIERVGSVQLEKQGVGDVSVAVTKATGAQKQEGSGQVFIRGLGDRSNSTTMNGLPIPSNDPMYKNIDLSIIKTDMIDFVGLEKVYNPRMWGDMSGANVDIVSKNYTGKPYFKVSIGSSYNTNALKKNHFYLQDGPDFLGTKQINKPSNAKLSNYGYAFTTSWKNVEAMNPFGSSLALELGRSFNIGEQGKLSIFGYGSFDNDYSYLEGSRKSVDNTGASLKDLMLQEYGYDTNSTGLLNLNYRLNPSHNIKFTTNFIHTTEQKLENYEGYIRDTNEDRINETAFLRRATYKTNDLWINQLAGEHKVTEPLKVFWSLGYNRLDSRRPDRQQNISVLNNNTGLHHFLAGNAGANNRYFDKLIENMYVGDVHADYSFSDNAKLSVGYQANFRESDFKAYQYNFRVNLSPGNYFVSPEDYGTFFNLTNYQSGGMFDIRTFWGILGTSDRALIPQYYKSDQKNHGVYGNLDYKFSDKFTAQLGVRYDMLQQDLRFLTAVMPSVFAPGEEGQVKKDYSKILPALNLKYSVNEYHNLRFSASKTYTTPLLLEIAPYEYEEVDELSYGNLDLKPADNYNADLKWEWFMNRNEVFSLTAFAKLIQNPIARTTVNSSSNSVSYVNVAEQGTVAGAEMELRKDLFNFDSSRIYTFLNATYLYSNHKLDTQWVNERNPNAQVYFSDTESKMQGASDFLANANLGYEHKWNSNTADFVVSYSYIGDNIYALGYQEKGPLVDKAINVLDAVLRFKFNNGIGMSLSGKNLLDTNFTRVQDNKNGEIIVRDYKRGRNFGIGLSYQF